MKVTDPVCKMSIDSEKAAATSEYKGQTIYFCAKGVQNQVRCGAGEVCGQVTKGGEAANPAPTKRSRRAFLPSDIISS